MRRRRPEIYNWFVGLLRGSSAAGGLAERGIRAQAALHILGWQQGVCVRQPGLERPRMGAGRLSFSEVLVSSTARVWGRVVAAAALGCWAFIRACRSEQGPSGCWERTHGAGAAR